MTSSFSNAKQPPQLDVPASATATFNRAESLWQRMLNAWIGTYELSFRSGAVPFLLL
jgi:hypothetical protein